MAILDFHLHYNGNIDDADRFVERWREGGVEKAVVFGMNRHDGSHTSLAEVAVLVERAPDFFMPFAYLNPGHEDCVSAVKEAAAMGFKGVKFLYPKGPYDLDEHFPIYEAAAEAKMVCLFHTGIVVGGSGGDGLHGTAFQGKWRISANDMRPMHMDRIARAFPDMAIVGAHVGSPSWFEEAASMLPWHENVYFDMSIGQFSYTRKNIPEGQEGRAILNRIRELCDCGMLNLNRILFGSDGVVGNPKADPTWALRTLKFEMEGLGATPEEKTAVSGGTAARLLGVEWPMHC